jgi:hypothetical protein
VTLKNKARFVETRIANGHFSVDGLNKEGRLYVKYYDEFGNNYMDALK